MSGLAELVAQLRRMDDAAWAALANRGLLRRARKDLDQWPSAADGLVTDAGDGVVVALGGHTVTLPPAGPRLATCSCTSSTMCQHVITAALWLVATTSAADPGPPATEPASAPEPPGASKRREPSVKGGDDYLHAQLMAVDETGFRAFGGLGAYRWAHQYLEDTEVACEVQTSSDGSPSVTMGRPRVTFRYFGGGLEGIVADQHGPQTPRYVIAAVLAYQRAHGCVLPPPLPAGSRGPTSRDLTIDESRSRLRVICLRLLEDTVSVGLSRLSRAVFDRFAMLATWAQGAQYPRLARSLRRVGDHVELLIDRSALADERRLLGELALTYALVSALAASAASANPGPSPTHLVGQARQRYQEVRSLEMVGLGALPWQSQTGYRGLTCVFQRLDAPGVLTWTDARPTTLAGFDPAVRWTQQGPWPGLRAPVAAVGARVRLTNARVSGAGRLSGADRTSAVVDALTGPELSRLLPVHESFVDVVEAINPRTRSLLGELSSVAPWVVLRPTAWDSAVFDFAEQLLTWRLVDAAGEALPAQVRYGPWTERVIERIEALSTGPVPDGTLIVARLRTDRGSLVLDPLSVVQPGNRTAAVDVLAFPHEGEPSAPAGEPQPGTAQTGSRVLQRLKAQRPRAVPSVASGVAYSTPVADTVPRALSELRTWLEGQSERGVGGALPARVWSELALRIAAVRQIGFTVFAEVADTLYAPAGHGANASRAVAAALLRTEFVLLQLTQALTGEAVMASEALSEDTTWRGDTEVG